MIYQEGCIVWPRRFTLNYEAVCNKYDAYSRPRLNPYSGTGNDLMKKLSIASFYIAAFVTVVEHSTTITYPDRHRSDDRTSRVILGREGGVL